MATSEVLSRQNGIGYLVLKNGTCKQVGWEVDLLRDGSIGDGCIRGDEEHLAAAAKDGCAKLHLAAAETAAIAINGHKHSEASFTTLLISSTPAVFYAQIIVGSSPILDGSQFSIEFSRTNGESLLVIVPTVIMRDYLPILQKVVPPRSPESASTSFMRLPETWVTGTAASNPLVCVKFNDEPPWALHPEQARQLAAELIERAEHVEARSQTAH